MNWTVKGKEMTQCIHGVVSCVVSCFFGKPLILILFLLTYPPHRSEAQSMHTNIIQQCALKITTLKTKYWRVYTIGGSKMKNDILKMKNGINASSVLNSIHNSSNTSIPTGGTLSSLSPSTQYVIRLRARNAVGWSAWSKESKMNNAMNKTNEGIFNIGHRYSSTRLWLTWNPSIEQRMEEKEKEKKEMKVEQAIEEKVPVTTEENKGKEAMTEAVKEKEGEMPSVVVPFEEEKKQDTEPKTPNDSKDIRIEFQDLLSYKKKSHEWTECIKYDHAVHEFNLNERKKYKQLKILQQKQERRDLKEKEEREKKRMKKKNVYRRDENDNNQDNNQDNHKDNHKSSSSATSISLAQNKAKTPFENDDDESMWALPLVEIDQLLPGHSYRFRLVEYTTTSAEKEFSSSKHSTVLGGGPSNWIQTATDVPGPPRNVQVLNETSSSIKISFTPPHVGPSTAYDIEYQLGIQTKPSKESKAPQQLTTLDEETNEQVQHVKLVRNRQHLLQPKGPWHYSGTVFESSSMDEDADEEDETKEGEEVPEDQKPSDDGENDGENDANNQYNDEGHVQHGLTGGRSSQTKTPLFDNICASEMGIPSVCHTFTINHLMANEYYRLRIFASNKNGIGEAAMSSFWVKTLPKPPTPSSLPPYISGKSSRSLYVEWEAANGFGEVCLLYRVQMRERVSKLHDEESSSDEEEDSEGEREIGEEGEQDHYKYTIKTNPKRGAWRNVGLVAKSVEEDDGWRSLEVLDLIPGKTFEFRLAAQSIMGWGEFGPASRSCQCEFEPPEVIDDLQIEIAGDKQNMLHVKWEEPHGWGKAIDFYEIEMQSKQNLNQWIPVCETPKQSRYIGLDVLTTGIPYRFRIRSVSCVGYSKFNKESKWWVLSQGV